MLSKEHRERTFIELLLCSGLCVVALHAHRT